MTDEEKDFSKNINIDKANIKTITCIILIIISLVTYAVPLLFGDFDFDFGIIFELLTLIFILVAKYYMSKYDIDCSKKYIIFAMIPIGWLLIYDLLTFLSSITDVLDFTLIGLDIFLSEGCTILALLCLFLINNDLKKADNPEKYKESTDWFYERPDENNK